jgi:predicted metal-dependent peptidase
MKDLNDKKFHNFYERWDWVVTFMVVEDKFVHEVLMMMDKRRDDSVETMGVSVEGTRINLVYCQKFVDSLSDPELRYVITHEIYHLVLHHCTIRLPVHEEDRKLYNKAADLAINSLIPQDCNRHMPKDKNGKVIGLLPSQYKFPDKLSMEQYVQLLRQKQEEDKRNGKGNGGSGSGGNADGDGDDGEPSGFDNHDGWKESEVIKEIVRGAVNKIARNERIWGSMPGDVKAIILAAQKSQVSWERYLKHYLGNLVSPTWISTMKRPDRRFGFPYPGKKRGYTDRKLVGIDTSGSIGEDELATFLCEVNKLSEIQPVDLVLFDDGIQYGPTLFDRKKVSFEFKGRGGTNFSEVFKLAEERGYQSVIMLTDGCAAAPSRPSESIVKDILWVITGTGNPPVEWGDVIRITPKFAPISQAA